MKEFFKPELRNRIDQICKFNKLETMSMKKIVAKFVNEMNDLLTDKHIKVRLNESAVDYLVAEGFDPKMGARPLGRKLNDLVKVPLSKKMLFESVPAGSTVIVEYVDGAITFDVHQSSLGILPTIDSNGYIVLDQTES
jgi:ATP-dependent Clp protease ATP-binding subunit ClpA